MISQEKTGSVDTCYPVVHLSTNVDSSIAIWQAEPLTGKKCPHDPHELVCRDLSGALGPSIAHSLGASVKSSPVAFLSADGYRLSLIACLF